MLLLGHRGARAEKSIPENSLASFDRALESGCDGIEFDVRLSTDGQAVICHDPKVRGLEVARCHAAQLALPYLSEVLKRYSASAFLDIELKVPGVEAVTLGLLRKFPPQRGYVISSFLPEVLREVHDLNDGTPLGLICETPEQMSHWPRLPVQYVISDRKLVTRESADEIKQKDKKVLVWTVNSVKEMKRFADLKVDGIISDDPEKLMRTLRNESD
jgi:glycerophosphoryl diester phosphodiesterase